tara:strand:+ start:777 stop:1202 length:426 start_codon:yes stop_codon:yes gene_type:complete
MEEQVQTTEPTTTQNQTQQEIPNRRTRRDQLRQQGILKYLSKKNFLDPIRANFRSENIKTGQKIQDIRRAKLEKQWEASFMAKLESMKETWYEIGYNSKEMEYLEEAAAIFFAKNKETYREDKKEAKQLMKKAKDSLASRK